MANVMYLPQCSSPGSTSQPFMFGATLAFQAFLKETDTVVTSQRNRLSLWRRNQLLQPALERIASDPVLPLDPKDVRQLVADLNVLFIGLLKPTYPEEPAGAETSARARKPRRAKMRTGPATPPVYSQLSLLADGLRPPVWKRAGERGHQPVSYDQLLSRPITNTQLFPLLEAIIRRCYTLSTPYESDTVLNTAIPGLFNYYVSTNVYATPLNRSPPPTEESLLPAEMTTIASGITNWWGLASNKKIAFHQLNSLMDKYKNNGNPASKSKTGYCAEVYLSVFVGTLTSMNKEIRGLATKPREIGHTDLFSTEGFNFTTLGKVPSVYPAKSVCRYPCEDCRIVLARLGIPADIPAGSTDCDYDKDMNEAEVNPS